MNADILLAQLLFDNFDNFPGECGYSCHREGYPSLWFKGKKAFCPHFNKMVRFESKSQLGTLESFCLCLPGEDVRGGPDYHYYQI